MKFNQHSQNPLSIYSNIISKESPLKFFYVTDPNDYAEILLLRLQAYEKSNKVNNSTLSHDLSDYADCKSKIIAVKRDNKILGSIRTTFLEESDPSFNYHFVKDISNIPPLENTAEGSRLCVSPQAQGLGLASKLEVLMILTAICGNRRYLIGSAEGTLIDFHVRYGFKRLGIWYNNENFGQIPHELLFLDTHAVLNGHGVEKTVWNNIYQPALKAFGFSSYTK